MKVQHTHKLARQRRRLLAERLDGRYLLDAGTLDFEFGDDGSAILDYVGLLDSANS